MIVKMIQDLGEKMETQIENLKELFNKKLEDFLLNSIENFV